MLLAIAFADGSVSGSATEDPTRRVEAHYIVFELDADGMPRAMSDRIVRLAEAPASRTNTAIERELATRARNAEQVVVRVLDRNRVVAFQQSSRFRAG